MKKGAVALRISAQPLSLSYQSRRKNKIEIAVRRLGSSESGIGDFGFCVSFGNNKCRFVLLPVAEPPEPEEPVAAPGLAVTALGLTVVDAVGVGVTVPVVARGVTEAVTVGAGDTVAVGVALDNGVAEIVGIGEYTAIVGIGTLVGASVTVGIAVRNGGTSVGRFVGSAVKYI